jgi:hypothetical protein
MEEYADMVTDMVAPDFNVIITTDLEQRVEDRTMKIAPGVLSACPTPSELKSNLVKRLKVAKGGASSADLCIVSILCLSSNDYSVSHLSL